MYTWKQFSCLSLILAGFLLPTTSALLDGLYCGTDNCYDVLEVTRSATKQEIVKAYRKMAKIHHPDMHRGAEAKLEAEEMFKKIATAYEILRDEESRNDYDYMLDNPNEYYSHYYKYYRRRVSPKVDIRVVVIVTITIISVFQYYSGMSRHEDAITYFTTIQKYRNKAMDLAKDDINEIINKKGKSKLSKSEQKKELEKIIRKVIEEKMDIKGAYAKPTIKDTLWIQLIFLPYTIGSYILWYIRWIVDFNILKKPLGDKEKLYLIRKYMKLGQTQFDTKEESEKSEYLEMELWIKANFEEWKEIQEEEQKKQLADNPRYKSYRRYMKNHGPGRMTFED